MKMSMTPRRPAKPGAAFTRIELAARFPINLWAVTDLWRNNSVTAQ